MTDIAGETPHPAADTRPPGLPYRCDLRISGRSGVYPKSSTNDTE
jgi:hypothetical protein